MTVRTVLIVVLALVFGGAAWVYATNVIQRQRNERPVEKVSVVYAVKTVNVGQALREDMLALKEVNKGEEPEDALHDIAELTKEPGRVSNVKIVKGATLQQGMLAADGTHEGLAAMIDEEDEPGMQAASILTPTAAAAVGGFIAPGNRVDVLLTVDHAGEGGNTTVLLMQRRKVLAAGNRTETNPSNVENKLTDNRELHNVTLLVTPKQGMLLALAQKQGTLTLTLRRPGDKTDPLDTVVTLDDLKLPVRKPDPKPPEVRPVANTKAEPPVPIRAFVGGMEYPIYLPK